MKNLTIGKVAKIAGIGTETVRFYEKEGLIGPAARTEANYRVYETGDITRLRFIRRAKALGFTLKEIKELLSLRHDPDASKEDVKIQTEAKIADIELKIRDLTRIKSTLETLDERCDGHGPANDCPILEALETGDGLDNE
jgi:Zn(II)-responsive transcriptional regulator